MASRSRPSRPTMWPNRDRRYTSGPCAGLFSPPIAVCHNPNGGNGEAIHQDRLSHALPTSDPDLAFIVGLWDRLADECKQRLIEIVRANLPRQGDADEFDEINERGD